MSKKLKDHQMIVVTKILPYPLNLSALSVSLSKKTVTTLSGEYKLMFEEMEAIEHYLSTLPGVEQLHARARLK